MAVHKTLGGAGAGHYLGNLYPESGGRVRLAARGGTLYRRKEGVDANYSAASGGTGLATNILNGVAVDDDWFFTDRSGHLQKFRYGATTEVSQVKQPAAPSAAPRTKKATAAVLEDWSSFWTSSNAGQLSMSDATAAEPNPFGGATTDIQFGTNSKGTTETENVVGESVDSHTIACYFQQSGDAKNRLSLRIGQNAAGDFAFGLTPPEKNEWFIWFADIGELASINFKDIRRTGPNPSSAQHLYISKLLLPGNLAGQYRWVYTHYDPTNKLESKPSAISNGGDPVDLSKVGVPYKNETSDALQKAVLLDFTSDSGVDATTTQMKLYRNGGIDELTIDENGDEVWTYVATLPDWSSTLQANALAAQNKIRVVDATGLAIGHWVLIDKGGTSGGSSIEEFGLITALTPGAGYTELTLRDNLTYAHTSTHAVQIAYLDNNGDETLDASLQIDLQRDDPPDGAQWILRSPEGRLVICGYTEFPDGISFSNLPTYQRTNDYTVFPNNVDPVAKQSQTQGFRIRLGSRGGLDAVVWAGYFRGLLTVITRKAVYQIAASSQADYSPASIIRVLEVGCLNGETVAEVNGELYWVAPGSGPQIVRWDGRSGFRDISFQRCNKRLESASSSYWSQWFGRAYVTRDGSYYSLFFVPVGNSTPTKRLDYCVNADAWEPIAYYDNLAAGIPFAVATVADGPGDAHEFYGLHPTSGVIYQFETGNTDEYSSGNTVGIRVTATTKRFNLGWVSKLERWFLYCDAAGSDQFTIQVFMGGSQYAETSFSYSGNSLAGTGEKEVERRAYFTSKGRWVQFVYTGTVTARPAPRKLTWRTARIRDTRLHT